MKSKQSSQQRKGREESDPAQDTEGTGSWTSATKLDWSLIIYKQIPISHPVIVNRREKINITCKKLTSSYDMFVLKVRIPFLCAKNVSANKGFLIWTGKWGREKQSSLLAYKPDRNQGGPKSTELIPSSISISSIFIHGFLLCFSLAPPLVLSLYMYLCNV